MDDVNTKEFADKFCNMVIDIMMQFKPFGCVEWNKLPGKCVENGSWTLYKDKLVSREYCDTFEIVNSEGDKIYCAIIEYVNLETKKPNRAGVIIGFPDNGTPIHTEISVTIPYAYGNFFTTRASRNFLGYYEIRHYGLTSDGEYRIKREEFFDYVEKHYPDDVHIDEKGRKYLIAYQYKDTLSKDEFVEQTFRLVKILSDFKNNKS